MAILRLSGSAGRNTGLQPRGLGPAEREDLRDYLKYTSRRRSKIRSLLIVVSIVALHLLFQVIYIENKEMRNRRRRTVYPSEYVKALEFTHEQHDSMQEWKHPCCVKYQTNNNGSRMLVS